jgi:hypothetical protein
MTSTSSFAVSALTVFLATSCATAPPPRNPEASAQASAAALRAAEEVGASRNPQAALHLQFAKEQLDQANRLTGEEADKRAPGLLMRARADADLALALARSDQASTRAKAAAEQLKQAAPAAR